MSNNGNWIWQTIVGVFVVAGLLGTWTWGARRLIRGHRNRRRQAFSQARRAAAAAIAPGLAFGLAPAPAPAPAPDPEPGPAATELPIELQELPQAAATGVDRSMRELPVGSEASFYTTQTHRADPRSLKSGHGRPLDLQKPDYLKQQRDPQSVLKSLKAQYTETLYRSRASLAYFAKGPLSRARAAFTDKNGANASLISLVDYLRTLIIPISVLDKKYRETLPDIISQIPSANISEGEPIEAAARFQETIRKPKKSKIGMNGLYPQEALDVRHWWIDQLASIPACDSADLTNVAVKTTVLELRAREIHLQIILILEVLALEALLSKSSVETEAVDQSGRNHDPQQKRKTKKPQDLDTLLDLSVDKLCIWQSMAVDENTTLERSGETDARAGESLPSKKRDSDRLRDFCVDVILPFYTVRLPDVSRMLCKKLGGPLAHSPARPPLQNAPSSRTTAKPGAVMNRAPPRLAGRTLERVLTDERKGRRPARSPSRSATDSVLPNLKREPSHRSLANVPSNGSAFQKSKMYSQREVDLTAVTQAAEAKAKKKANVAQELQGAIAALKRPNARMAVKEFVEAAEQRAAGAKSRKSKNPVRNPFAPDVQIMATPSANRRKDVYAGLHSQVQPSFAGQEEPEEIPPSSCTHVPASAVKQRSKTGVESEA
ncbi:MAG: hypothetical protein Q9207_001517 [Kuettlingeria erythrocarpa]